MFADRNDNTGGGAPGDGTGMLRTFIEAELEDACILYIVDPEAVAACQRAGAGSTLTLEVGGKSTPLQGEPVKMTAEVVALGDGRFLYEGPRNRGLEGDMGPSAHIRQGGLHVLVVSHREQPYDTALARTLDPDPREMRYIGLKSAGHFRACYEEFAGNIFVVSEPNVHDHERVVDRYVNLGRKVYPFEIISAYRASQASRGLYLASHARASGKPMSSSSSEKSAISPATSRVVPCSLRARRVLSIDRMQPRIRECG